MKTRHVHFYKYFVLLTNLKAQSMYFLIDASTIPIIVAERANVTWDCLHLKFVGAVHGKHIDRIKWPHIAAAFFFYKGCSSIVF